MRNYASDKPYQLVKNGDNYESVDPSMILGLTVWDDETGGLAFTGYADYDMTYSPVIDTVLTNVDGQSEKWSVMFSDGSGWFTDVVATDNAVYVKGIHSTCPDAWVKIDIDGNKGTLQPQFLGKDDNWHWAYALGGTVTEEWVEEWEDYNTVVTPQGPAAFSYDAAQKKLTGEGFLMIAPTTSGNSYTSYFEKMTVEHQTRTLGTPPYGVTNISVEPFDMDWGCGSMNLEIPTADTDGNLIDSKYMSFKIYIDGDPLTFYPDEYVMLAEEMNEIPWGFNDGYDFYSSGIYHSLYYYVTGFETIGVQVFYHEPETNEVLASKITTYQMDVNGLNAIEAPVKSVEYFDLQGRAVAKPVNGLFIRRTTLTNGTVSTAKVVK